jgi:hypothetical protein
MTIMADVTNEVAASGQAIADFIEELGKAVAAGQEALDKNTGDVAAKLSKVLVEVPGIIQEIISDDGLPIDAKIHNNKVPMSTIILPPAYQFSRVFFQADLKLSEMDKKNGIRLVKSAASLKGDAKVNLDLMSSIGTGALPGVNLGASGSISSSDRNQTQSSATDQAIAVLHFEATLEPRREIQVPTPVRLRVAPRVTVAIVDYKETSATPAMPAVPGGAAAVPFAPAKRTATVSISVFKADGTKNTAAVAAKLQYSADASDLIITAAGNDPVKLTIDRSQSAEADPLPPRAATIVRVTLGSITEQLTLNI